MPIGALPAEIVSIDELTPHWIDGLENVALAPATRFVVDSVTGDEKPPEGTQVTTVVPDDQGEAVICGGESCIRKSCEEPCATATEREADRVTPPPVP